MAHGRLGRSDAWLVERAEHPPTVVRNAGLRPSRAAPWRQTAQASAMRHVLGEHGQERRARVNFTKTEIDELWERYEAGSLTSGDDVDELFGGLLEDLRAHFALHEARPKLFVVSHRGWGTQIDVVRAHSKDEASTLSVANVDAQIEEMVNDGEPEVLFTYEYSPDSPRDRE